MGNTSFNAGRPWCLAVLLAILIALAGCGGGDVDDHVPAVSTLMPVNCSATPKACQ